LAGQLFDLPYQEALLVYELLVLGAVVEEVGQEAQQLLAVADQNALHRYRLVGVGDEDLCMSVLLPED
jgi:hypothetical protein